MIDNMNGEALEVKNIEQVRDIPFIDVRGLSKAFGRNAILNEVSFSLNRGESFVIIGGSGTGKSVLIKSILGLIDPDKGEIRIDGVLFSTLSANERRKTLKRFGMLFQGGALFDSMTIAENIAFGLVQGAGMNKEKARKIALEKLDAVDLSKKVADLYPAELSGGMQKRVALARAIATNPEVIFFDEPTTGLDPIISGTINDLIVRCVREIGASAVTITHDIKSLRQIADRVGLLHKGQFIWQGTLSEIDCSENPYLEQFINGNPHGPFTD
ncbi:MAG: ATP-binding cassette domain-containing protein [Candidatus Paracaedibacteraceae bacterium]|nr:ATP-binding cassette domain-containing protein [Candidatus Paracaedibacteraceae bacterium]